MRDIIETAVANIFMGGINEGNIKRVVDNLVDEGFQRFPWAKAKQDLKVLGKRAAFGAAAGAYATSVEHGRRHLKKNPRKEGESRRSHIKRIVLSKKANIAKLKAAGRGAVSGAALGGIYHSYKRRND